MIRTEYRKTNPIEEEPNPRMPLSFMESPNHVYIEVQSTPCHIFFANEGRGGWSSTEKPLSMQTNLGSPNATKQRLSCNKLYNDPSIDLREYI